MDLRVVHLSGIWPQVYQSYLQAGRDGVRLCSWFLRGGMVSDFVEGWCQTSFLVLTCRLRNQKQSLIPGSTAVVLTVAGAGLRIGILAYQQHAAIGEVERFGGRVNMPGPPHQFFLCFWGVLCSYNHSII